MESICELDSNLMIFLTMITSTSLRFLRCVVMQAKGVKPCATRQETGVIETRVHPKESPGMFKCLADDKQNLTCLVVT